MDTQSPLISQIEKMIADVLRIQDQVISTIKTHLTENGIALPFPTQQVLFHDQTEVMDGDRTRQREGCPFCQCYG